MQPWSRGKWGKCACAARLESRSITRTVHSAGTAGEVFAGEVATAPSEIVQVLVDRSLDPKKSVTYQEYAKLMKWADEFRALGVRANADTPEQVKNAVAFGAEGIGLTRTEHMF